MTHNEENKCKRDFQVMSGIIGMIVSLCVCVTVLFFPPFLGSTSYYLASEVHDVFGPSNRIGTVTKRDRAVRDTGCHPYVVGWIDGGP